MPTEKNRNVHPYDEEAGKILRRVRRTAGLTQEQLADKAGVKFQQVQKYETGMNRMSVSRLRIICEFLGVKPSMFFGETQGTTASITEEEFAFLKSYRLANRHLQAAAAAVLTSKPIGKDD